MREPSAPTTPRARPKSANRDAKRLVSPVMLSLSAERGGGGTYLSDWNASQPSPASGGGGVRAAAAVTTVPAAAVTSAAAEALPLQNHVAFGTMTAEQARLHRRWRQLTLTLARTSFHRA